MKEYLAKFKDKDIDSIAVVLYINDGKAGELSKKLNEKNTTFAKDGRSWASMLSTYFEKNHPEIFLEIEFDPEPIMLTTYFALTKENEALSKKYIELLENFIEQEIPLGIS
jgi:predicted helicase